MAKKVVKKVVKKDQKKDVKKEPKKVIKNDKTGGAIILSIIILILSQVMAELVASIFHWIKVPEFICNIIAGGLYIVFAYLLLKKMCARYLHAKIEDYYMPKFKIRWHWILVGLLLPLTVVAVYQLFFKGTYIVPTLTVLKRLSIITAAIFFIGIGCAYVEEMVFRGIIMNALDKRYNRTVAIIAPSVLFGFVHILGMNYNLLSSILVIIAGTMVGIMFSLIAQVKKCVWDSAIVHALWNIITTSGILYIGNVVSDDNLINYVIKNKSFFVTGGEFGIESSIIAVIGYIIISVLTLYYIKKVQTKKAK